MKVDRCIKIVLKFNQRPHFCVLSYVRIWRIWLKTREKAISRSLTPKNIIYQLELSPRWVDYYFYHPFYQYRKESTPCCLVGVFFVICSLNFFCIFVFIFHVLFQLGMEESVKHYLSILKTFLDNFFISKTQIFACNQRLGLWF